jgi:ATP-dependent DNA helicase 2 subunit 2
MALKIKDSDAPFEIVLLGLDFDDPDVGYKEEGKDPQKVRNTRAKNGYG